MHGLSIGRAGLTLTRTGSFRSLVVHPRLLRSDETSFADPQPAWVFPEGSTAEGSSSNPHAGPFAYTAAVLLDGSVRLHCHLSSDYEASDSGKSFSDSNLAVRTLVIMADALKLRDSTAQRGSTCPA